MMKRSMIVVLGLMWVLTACTAAQSATPKISSETATANGTIAQSPSLTSTPLPSQSSTPISSATSIPTQSASEFCDQLLKNYHPVDGYQTYCDVDYGFAFDYPSSWQNVMALKAPGSSLPSTPRKVMIFHTEEDMSNFIYTYTYNLDNGRTLQERVENSLGYNDRAFPDKTYPSLVLGGHKAYAWMECSPQAYNTVFLYFQHGQFYTVMYVKGIDRSGLDTNWQIARSIQTPGYPPDKNVIPQELVDDSYQLLSCYTPPTPQPGSLVLKELAQTGGSINGVTVVGDVAYVGMGPRVAAIDISKHGSPRLIGQSQPLPGQVTQLLPLSPTVPNRLIVSAGKYLFEMDISDRTAMGSLFPIQFPGAITAMLLDAANNTLYVGGMVYQAPYQYTGFIQSLHISADGVPNLLELIDFPAPPFSFALGAGSLYIGADGDKGGLYRIKLDTPGTLSIHYPVNVLGAVNNYFVPYGMQVIGDRLYMGVGMDLQAYDITNPDQPVQVWKEFIGFMPESFIVYGSQVDIFGWGAAGAYIPGYATLAPPEPVVGSKAGVAASITAAYHDEFLVAFHDFEVYSSTDLKLLGSYQPAVISTLGVAADDSTVYVVDGGAFDGRDNATLRLFSLPDLRPLSLVQTDIPSSCCWFSGIAVEGDRAYVASSDTLYVYDVSSDTPSLLAKPNIVEGQLDAITAVKVNGKRLLFTAQDNSFLSTLTAYDISDLQKPVKIGNTLPLETSIIHQMAWQGSHLYAILTAITEGASDRLYIISFDNNTLTLHGTLNLTGSIFSLAVNEGLAATAGTDGLSIISISDPASPQVLAQISLPEIGGKISLVENHAIVTAGGVGGVANAASLLLFDLQTPANPRQVKALDIGFNEIRMGPMPVSALYIVLAGGSSGIEVLEYHIQQ